MRVDLYETKASNAGYEGVEAHFHYPEENKIIVRRAKTWDEIETKLGGDPMGLAGFNRARRLAAKKNQDPNSRTSKKDLIQFAKDREIEINEDAKKADILFAIREVLE